MATSQASAQASSTPLVAGIIAPVVALLTPLFPIALVISVAASIAALVTGWQEYQRIQAGDIAQSETPKVLLGMAGGGLGCLLQVVMGVVAVFIVLFAVMLGAAAA